MSDDSPEPSDASNKSSGVRSGITGGRVRSGWRYCAAPRASSEVCGPPCTSARWLLVVVGVLGRLVTIWCGLFLARTMEICEKAFNARCVLGGENLYGGS